MNLKLNRGFTLIELLITLTIITLFFSLGITQYNKFNRRQILVKARDQLISDLRLAQSKSLAAEKPVDCTESLSGIKVKFTDNQNYKIVAICGEEIEIKTGLSLPPGVTKQSGPNEIFFKVLSQGTSFDSTIVLSSFEETQMITINKTGEIK